MSEITIFSKHIPIKTIKNADFLLSDIELFNRILHTACSAKTKAKRDGIKEGAFDKNGNRIDLRKAENKTLKKSLPESLYVRLKKKYHTDDYFTKNQSRMLTSPRREMNAPYQYIFSKKTFR